MSSCPASTLAVAHICFALCHVLMVVVAEVGDASDSSPSSHSTSSVVVVNCLFVVFDDDRSECEYLFSRAFVDAKTMSENITRIARLLWNQEHGICAFMRLLTRS
jgi:hypothetical protein